MQIKWKLSVSVAAILTVLSFSCPPADGQRLENIWMDRLVNVTPLERQQDTISLFFIGDVMMHARQLEYDFRTFLEPLRSRISGADLAVANMEFTLAGEPYSGYPAFSAPDGYAAYLADLGTDVFLTANNHILDKGRDGLERTIEVYRVMDGILMTGTSEDPEHDEASYPLMVSVKGTRIALINFTYGTNVPPEQDWPKVNYADTSDIRKAFDRARAAGAEFIIALPHWGTEYALAHSFAQERLARWLADSGADMIIGAHPHVVQDTTTIGSTPVVYSMGNAVSNMSAVNTRLELAVTVRIVRNGKDHAIMHGPELEFLWCTLPGTLTASYTTIPVRDYIGKRDLWIDPSDYDNMIATLRRVMKATGIKDTYNIL